MLDSWRDAKKLPLGDSADPARLTLLLDRRHWHLSRVGALCGCAVRVLGEQPRDGGVLCINEHFKTHKVKANSEQTSRVAAAIRTIRSRKHLSKQQACSVVEATECKLAAFISSRAHYSFLNFRLCQSLPQSLRLNLRRLDYLYLILFIFGFWLINNSNVVLYIFTVPFQDIGIY